MGLNPRPQLCRLLPWAHTHDSHPVPRAVAQRDISIGICSTEKSHPWEPNYIVQRSTPFKGLARLVKEAPLQGLPPQSPVQPGWGKGCLPLPQSGHFGCKRGDAELVRGWGDRHGSAEMQTAPSLMHT